MVHNVPGVRIALDIDSTLHHIVCADDWPDPAAVLAPVLDLGRMPPQ
jgi:hypothetical protein